MAPPPAHISDYDARFFPTCTFPLPRRLRYGTRPTIHNGLPLGNPSATSLVLSPSASDESGFHIATADELGDLTPGEIVKLEIEPLLEGPPAAAYADVPGMFDLVRLAVAGEQQVEPDAKVTRAGQPVEPFGHGLLSLHHA